ncbi:uncharacterized protein LOC111907334 [Lactuca sativa]|uniref:uncharacterized protein LOC111907334 n=1 Tax=Lactuca sativa TaxID=4236 RepID=UPI0022AF5C47|nr:uncharacterized protein LOC111907334 [Lactuca sativa]
MLSNREWMYTKRLDSRRLFNPCIHLFWGSKNPQRVYSSLFRENLDHPWARFSDIPNEALLQMFSRFGEKLMGKPPTQYDVFVKTHGTAESKKKYFEGNHENIEYCSQTAKEALEGYLHGLVNKFGEDPSNRKDDVDVWEETQLRRKGKKKGAIYGIGASDIHFLVLGTPSSQSTQSTQSTSTQQEVDRLRAQVSVMEQQQQMKEQMEMVMRMINISGNQPRGPPDNPPEDN